MMSLVRYQVMKVEEEMPAQSSRMTLDPQIRERLDTNLEFVNEHRHKIRGLARSVSEAVGCTSANVYSVWRGDTYNATIIRESYAQVCRYMGMLESEESLAPDSPLDDKAVHYLTQVREGRHQLKQLLIDFRDLNNKIKRLTKDLRVQEGTMELFLRWNLEEIDDIIASEMREYLREVGFEHPTSMPTQAVDTEDVSQAVLDAMAMLQASGEINADGFLSEGIQEPEEVDEFEESESGDYVITKN
jgi:hypothetical protein